MLSDSPRAKPIFKVPGVKPHCLYKLKKLNPTGFKSHMLWTPIFPVKVPCFRMPVMVSASVPSLCLWSSSHLWLVSHEFGSQLHFCPSYTFQYSLLSMLNCGKFVLPVFRLFSELPALMWLLSRCVPGRNEFRILLSIIFLEILWQIIF